ncbi:MAG: hypothetical protein CMJ18_03525 [Phycisphaeraceae bacterium]|nr:hypothetical protein [Phycisphaeraceae bacterium]
MAGDKTKITFEIYTDSNEMLEKIRDQFNLPDTSKAPRCLLDFAASDGDWDNIFGEVRCRRCG